MHAKLFSAFVLTLTASCLALSTSTAQADFIAPNLPGNTQFDGWDTLTAAANPGYPGYPGTGAWPAPIGSNVAGSGDATLMKTANGPGGGPYPSGSFLYHGGTSTVPNTLGGSLAITDNTPVANLQTVVFQIKISEAYGYDLYSHAAPLLSYNDGSQNIAPVLTSLTSQVQTGTFNDPVTGLPEPVYTNEWYFQWDLSAIGEPIDSFSVGWSSVQHALIYALQLDQGDLYVVPEPGTCLLASLGALGLLVGYRRRRQTG